MKYVSHYEAAFSLNEKHFFRLTGVKKNTFRAMMLVLTKAEQQKRRRGGPKSKMRLEDQLLMSLEYLREYRTYFHVGQRYGARENDCYRKCAWVEDTLIKSRAFRLPGKKEILKNPTLYEVVLVDATESPVERPQKKSKRNTESNPGKPTRKSTTRGRRNGIRSRAKSL